jgi:two-component system copper resistance phosphate regulon response regulator CusR
MRILVIDAEENTIKFLTRNFNAKSLTFKVARSGPEGLAMAEAADYTAILMEVALPGMDGWEVLRTLRGRGKQTPVIFLSNRNSVADRVKGLELGADDYLTKPFAFSELLARLHNVLRRGEMKKSSVLKVGDLEVDVRGLRIRRAGKSVHLTPKEFALLTLLAQRAGEVLSRSRIAERIWNMDFESDTNVVDVHMHRLRAKVDEQFDKKLIHTVRGVGYVLEER